MLEETVDVKSSDPQISDWHFPSATVPWKAWSRMNEVSMISLLSWSLVIDVICGFSINVICGKLATEKMEKMSELEKPRYLLH